MRSVGFAHSNLFYYGAVDWFRYGVSPLSEESFPSSEPASSTCYHGFFSAFFFGSSFLDGSFFGSSFFFGAITSITTGGGMTA